MRGKKDQNIGKNLQSSSIICRQKRGREALSQRNGRLEKWKKRNTYKKERGLWIKHQKSNKKKENQSSGQKKKTKKEEGFPGENIPFGKKGTKAWQRVGTCPIPYKHWVQKKKKKP